MDTNYEITLAAPIPQGADILNKPCTMVFNYADGSHSDVYSGTTLSSINSTVRISSRYLNIDSAWTHDVRGGTLDIATGGGLVRTITNFVKLP